MAADAVIVGEGTATQKPHAKGLEICRVGHDERRAARWIVGRRSMSVQRELLHRRTNVGWRAGKCDGHQRPVRAESFLDPSVQCHPPFRGRNFCRWRPQ